MGGMAYVLDLASSSGFCYGYVVVELRGEYVEREVTVGVHDEFGPTTYAVSEFVTDEGVTYDVLSVYRTLETAVDFGEYAVRVSRERLAEILKLYDA